MSLLVLFSSLASPPPILQTTGMVFQLSLSSPNDIARAPTMAAGDERIMSWNFGPQLWAGESVQSFSVEIFNNDGPPPTRSTSLSFISTGQFGNIIAAEVMGGTFGDDYLITYTANTNFGEVIQNSIRQFVGQT